MKREDLHSREISEDWIAELRQSWRSYAMALGKAAEVADEERAKFVDETWKQYESRKAVQRAYIAGKLRERAAADDIEARLKQDRAKTSANIVSILMKRQEEETARTRTQPRHWLYADFDTYQRTFFANQRNALCVFESISRAAVDEWQSGFRDQLHLAADCERTIARQKQVEREQKEERQRIEAEAERQREIAAEKEREKKLRLEEEAAERQRKEQLEIEKKLERKRREEEKRAKARAERERMKNTAGSERKSITEEGSHGYGGDAQTADDGDVQA